MLHPLRSPSPAHPLLPLLQPENILLRRDVGTGDIVGALGDFGLSKLYPARPGALPGRHATTHTLLGTPG
jgi:hypothetical protein